MTMRQVRRSDLDRAIRILRTIRAIGIAAGAVCIGLAAFALTFEPPLLQTWLVFYVICFVSMLATIFLVTRIRGIQPESPLRVWPYYVAIAGLLLLLIVVGGLVLIANMRFL